MSTALERPRSFVRESPYEPLPHELREQLITLGKGLREVEVIPEWDARWSKSTPCVVTTVGSLTPLGLQRLMGVIVDYKLPVSVTIDNCGWFAFLVTVFDHTYQPQGMNVRRLQPLLSFGTNHVPQPNGAKSTSEAQLTHDFQCCIQPLLDTAGYAEVLEFYGFDPLPERPERFEY